jgi:hypothetical protein
MIGAVDSDVAETGVAVALRSAHLILGEKNIAVAPYADDWNLHARERLSTHQAQVRAVVIQARRESPGTRQSRPDVPKLGRIPKH